MAMYLQIAFYVSLIVLFGVLILGLVNMTRSDDGQASRSNKLMRLRVRSEERRVGKEC